MTKESKPIADDKLFYTIVGVVALLTVGAALSYGWGSKDPISSAFKKAYPIAVVGGNVVTVYEWEQNKEIARSLDPQGNISNVARTLIENKKKEKIFRKYKLDASASKFNQEFWFEQSESKSAYQDLINKYFFGDEKLFITYVVIPNYIDSALRVKYNSDIQTNVSSYNKAKGLLERINKGEKFEELAKTESDDHISGQLGGDLGLVSRNQIFPELAAVLYTAPIGQVKNEIVISREGYHIIYPVESGEREGEKVWHIKHILVSTEGYEKWLSPKLSEISVWRLR